MHYTLLSTPTNLVCSIYIGTPGVQGLAPYMKKTQPITPASCTMMHTGCMHTLRFETHWIRTLEGQTFNS
ncbi:hypothetical protein GDO81_005953 [Engystomops pustulosus]|uniref:Uncharacterized protein n=1 Tax=Engystomops pustulosus TaxID=76066 RepID=A0AAV7CTP1_ENGPU|nr:hypothetical protein GDO81_005953 [Engystomops pustulosus]